MIAASRRRAPGGCAATRPPQRAGSPSRRRRRGDPRLPPATPSGSWPAWTAARRSTLEQVHPDGLFEGSVSGAEVPLRYRARGRLSRRQRLRARRSLRVPAHARRARPLPGRRGSPRGDLLPAGRPRARDRGRRRAPPSRSGRPPPRAVSVVGDFNSWDGRLHAMRAHGRVGHLGALRPRRRAGRPLQVRDPHPGRGDPPQGRSLRLRGGAAAGDRLDRPRLRAPLGGRRVDGAQRARPSLTAARCRSTRSTSAPGGATRSRTTARSPTRSWPTSWPPTSRPRLHPRGAAAGDGPPLRGVMGLPGDRVLRPRRAVGLARRPAGIRGSPARRTASA